MRDTSVKVTRMAANANVMWILVVAGLALMQATAAARELSTSTGASLDATTTVTTKERSIEWLKITAVPLVVFLLGACTWGCIKNAAFWTNCFGRGPGESGTPRDIDEVRPADHRPIHSRADASHLEKGTEFSHNHPDDGLAGRHVSPTLLAMQQRSALQSPNDEGNSAGVAPQE